LAAVLPRSWQLANSDWNVLVNANTKLQAIEAVEQSVRFDAKGMRFHLPAYLIADLRGQLTQDIRFHLNTRRMDDRYSLLTAAQREAVRQFLVLQLDLLPEPNLQFEGKSIRASVDGYWAHEHTPKAS